MFATNWSCGCVMLALLHQTTGLAQHPSDYYVPPTVEYQPVSPWPPHMGESYHHDSTAAGNYLRGLAGVVHAYGNYSLSRSQAAILHEYARSLQVNNRQHWINVYRENLRRAESERQQKLEAKRLKNEATRLAIYEAAYRLSNDELNRETGEIAWPVALQPEEYTDLRLQFNYLYRQLAVDPGNADVSAMQTRVLGDRLGRSLERNRKHIMPSDYITARKFLCGLKYEPAFAQPINMVTSALVDENRKLGMN